MEESGFVSPVPVPQLSTRPSRQTVQEQVRILAMDDDPQALRYVRDTLVKSGYAAIATGDPNDVPRLMEKEKPHLVLLDLMLPGADGIELMQDIMNTGNIPVIFVSAYGQDRLVARAFEMGADDYVVKPFSPTELVARIRAVLRRRAASEPTVLYVTGDLIIDYAQRLVSLRGIPVTLNRHRVPVTRRAVNERGAGADLRAPAETSMGLRGRRRREAHAHRNKLRPPQAGRRR